MASGNSSDGIFKILFALITGLLAVTSYFLASRDGDIKNEFRLLSANIIGITATIEATKLDVEKIRGELNQRTDIIKWILEGSGDREKRIRVLEEKCRVIGK